jgi:glycolate oxidase
MADTTAEKERLWKLRYSIGEAMTTGKRKYRDIDAVVPVSKLYQYITQVEKICSDHSIELIYFGHAFDGNLHTMLLTDKLMDAEQEQQLKLAVTEIYSYAVSLGGILSGEHGIGYLQRDYMPIQFSDTQLKWMKQLKELFDPNAILNPGKMI